MEPPLIIHVCFIKARNMPLFFEIRLVIFFIQSMHIVVPLF